MNKQKRSPSKNRCFCNCVKCTSLFSQGVIDLVLDCIDRLHQHSSHFSEGTQSDTEEEWKIILNCFYDLLGETCIYLSSP